MATPVQGDWDVRDLTSKLLREDLEGVALSRRSLTSTLDGFEWRGISRLSRPPAERPWPSTLHSWVEDLITGFYGQLRPWAFLLLSRNGRLECRFGAKRLEGSDLADALRAVFPDARLEVAQVDIGDLERLPHAVALTGSPATLQIDGKAPRAEQIDRLCRSLRTFRSMWAYVVTGSPVPIGQVGRLASETADWLFQLHLRYSSRNEPAMRIKAQRATELLERKVKQLEAGRASGLWSAQALLLSEDRAIPALGGGLLRAAFRSEASAPNPVRVHVVRPDVRAELELEPLDTEACATLARPPLEDYPAYEVIEAERFGVQPPRVPLQARGLVDVAAILDRGMETGERVRLALDDLTKHAMIAGVTGSGKTTTCVELLRHSQAHHIPFLVLEPAKSEYRHKLRSANPVVFSVGDETDSPLRINPFEIPDSTAVQTHIDYLKALFMAAFVLYPPMPYILETALQQIYEDRGWDVVTNENSRGADHPRRFPTLSDLIAKAQVIVDTLGYSGELQSNIRAALVARLENLRAGGGKGPMFDVRTSVPDTILFEGPCILELKHVVNDDEKAFLMGLILMRLYEYHEGRAKRGAITPGLCHLTLIEEAHRLLRNVHTGPTSDFANPKGQAIETFSNMLAEIRAYGEGILVAEQIPTKLTPDVVKNTNLKIIHRTVAAEDRTVLGAAMNLSPGQAAFLTRLNPGEALIYAEGLERPVLARIAAGPEGDASVPDESPPQNGERARAASMPLWVGRHLDRPLETAFRRLLNILRRTPTDLNRWVACRVEFQIASQRTKPYRFTPAEWWAALLERDLERRAEFYRWPHAEVDVMLRLGLKAFQQTEPLLSLLSETENGEVNDEATDALQQIEALEEADENGRDGEGGRHWLDPEMQGAIVSMESHVVAFGTHWRELCDTADPPFAGCDVCVSICHFRFDMAGPLHADVESMRPDRDSEDSLADELARLGKAAANEWFEPDDTMLTVQAILCWAVQQIGRGPMGSKPSDWQRHLAAKVEERAHQEHTD